MKWHISPLVDFWSDLHRDIQAKAPESSGAFFYPTFAPQRGIVLQRLEFVHMWGCHYRRGIRAKSPEPSGDFFYQSPHKRKDNSKTWVRPRVGMPFPQRHKFVKTVPLIWSGIWLCCALKTGKKWGYIAELGLDLWMN